MVISSHLESGVLQGNSTFITEEPTDYSQLRIFLVQPNAGHGQKAARVTDR